MKTIQPQLKNFSNKHKNSINFLLILLIFGMITGVLLSRWISSADVERLSSYLLTTVITSVEPQSFLQVSLSPTFYSCWRSFPRLLLGRNSADRVYRLHQGRPDRIFLRFIRSDLSAERGLRDSANADSADSVRSDRAVSGLGDQHRNLLCLDSALSGLQPQ